MNYFREILSDLSYCEFIGSGRASQAHIEYHDTEYGCFSADATVLFERLLLEINQAGLSWDMVLK